MKKQIALSGLLLILGTFAGIWYFKTRPREEVHIHAGFLVYVDGVQQDFTANKYMHLEPCALDEQNTKHSPQEEQLERAHLHDNVGEVVHIHRTGATWQDLFTNIGYAFPKDKSLVGYVNGKKVSNILNRAVNAYDSVIFVVGVDAYVDLTKQVTKDYIINVENSKESC